MRTLCVVLALILSGCVSASGASHDSPEPVPSFRVVPVDGSTPLVPDVSRPKARLPPLRPDVGRPVVPVPTPRLIVVAKASGDRSEQARVAGVASWYCGHGSPCTRGYSGGLYAAAGPGLRTGAWRGRRVMVVAGGQSVRVTLIDWCACPHGRLLDLYSDAFSRLAPLSRGVIRIEVIW